jgi:hypothetical protein
VQTELRLCREEAGSDDERIAWQEESDQQPGFGEDDQREADISTRLYELADVGELVKEIGEGRHAER